MDKIEHSDESRTTLPLAAGEHEIADYLDGVIAALLADKAREREVAEAAPDDRPKTGLRGPKACLEQQGAGNVAVAAPASDSGDSCGEQPDSASRPCGPGRASMREELLALFASPGRLAAPPSITPVFGVDLEPNGPGSSADGMRAFEQRFMPTVEKQTSPVSLGLGTVDAYLGGGFGPGLHLVAGRKGAGKTAFLDTIAWEAVSSERPVLYYTLKEGTTAARSRLMGTLAAIMGFSFADLNTLPDQGPVTKDLGRLRSVERTLQSTVLTRVSLIDHIPAYTDMFEAFSEDLRLRSREAQREHGELPVVLIDDSAHLMHLTQSRPLTNLLSRLNETLTEAGTTAIIGVLTPERPAQGIEGLPVQTTLTVTPTPGSSHDTIECVDLRILTNKYGGRTDTIPLLLDRRAGMLALRD